MPCSYLRLSARACRFGRLGAWRPRNSANARLRSSVAVVPSSSARTRNARHSSGSTNRFGQHLAVSPRCMHVKGHGGAKAAVRQVWKRLPTNGFVLRTDVKSYYASIDHFMLLDQLTRHIRDGRVLNLIGQYL